MIIAETLFPLKFYQAPEEKEKRTKIHLAIKNTYNNLETRTVEKDDKKFIEAYWRTGV